MPITGFSSGPVPVWVDANGKFFALDLGLTWIPGGLRGGAAGLLAQGAGRCSGQAAFGRAYQRSCRRLPTGPVTFSHVRAFVDGDALCRRRDGGRGPRRHRRRRPQRERRSHVPAGAKVIDGRGETLVPGLWDSHQHVSDDSAGPMLLSLGVTSVRDPGNVTAATLSRADRRAKGTLLMPHVYPSMLIDGKGPNTAQVGTSVASLDEALATVRKAHDDGFIAIKFYGTFNPGLGRADGGGGASAGDARPRSHPGRHAHHRRDRRLATTRSPTSIS